MQMMGIGKQGMTPNRYLYNAQTEREESFGLQWDETPFRRYDPQLGRFHGVDALAAMMPGITPYQYAFNNPILFNDPSGLSPEGQDDIDDQRLADWTKMNENLAKKEDKELDAHIDRNTERVKGN